MTFFLIATYSLFIILVIIAGPYLSYANLLIFLKNLYPQTKSGQMLSVQLVQLQIEGHAISNKIQLVEYKFYTQLVQKLIQSAIVYGTAWQQHLPNLKQGLLQDIQFDQRIFSLFLQGLYQIFLILIFTFGSVYLLESQLQISFKLSQLLLPLLLQILGLALYTLTYYQMRFRSFSNWQKIMEKVYSMRTLCTAQIPLKLIHEKLQLDEIPPSKEFEFYQTRLVQFLHLIKTQGRVDEADVDMLISELWQLAISKFEHFHRLLTAFKLGIICLFSLSGFLALFYQVFSDLAL